MNTKTVLGMGAAALAAVVVLAGCGTSTTPAAPGAATTTTATATAVAPAAAHNDADVAFVQGMIPHHAQAISMSQLADQRASNPQVKQLATQIAQAQGPEIQQMQAMLGSWGLPAQPTGAAGMSGMNGMDHNNMGGMPAKPGMMSDQQMQQLGTVSGAAFDRMWLQMMIQHHTGAVQMSQTELRGGQNGDAKALAQTIITGQQAQIAQMQNLLKTI
ncbi:DUF305 domain-containing protein [Pseudonocardia sp.]|jgi:uncharacterized protein (DUF305 family)|uniref:DUF305 domain-containing protein n=1 Tax=Pseudonocardia sp. TaxID=60912 RepID=UPI0031FE41EF